MTRVQVFDMFERMRQQQMLDNLPWEKKKIKHKEKRLNFKSRITSLFWKSEARKVCEERLAHYESKGNERKADIYRRKLGIKTLGDKS